MKKSIILLGAALGFLAPCRLHAGVGQSAVITLVFPWGARSCAMGEVGTALADDESAPFYNPAGLNVPNRRFQGGAGTVFYEPLLPAFHLKGLWHTASAGILQDSSFGLGAFGVFVNYINMGVNSWTDELGRELARLPSFETVAGVEWGFDFKDAGLKNNYFGLTLKYIQSALAPGIGPNGAGTGRDFAVDLGYLLTIGRHFRFGATLMNMGPSIYYIDPENADPIPFTVNIALAYKNDAVLEELPVGVAAELRLDKELVKSHFNGPPDPFYKALITDFADEPLKQELWQINEHLGGEITLMNTLSLRSGILFDLMGERYEYCLGFGVNFLDHYSGDFSWIISPEGFMRKFARRFDPAKTGATGVRNGQFRISLNLTRLLSRDEKDLSWWDRK